MSNSKTLVRIELRRPKPKWDQLTERQHELLAHLNITEAMYAENPWKSVLATRRQAREMIGEHWPRLKGPVGGYRIALDAQDIEAVGPSFFHEWFLTFPSEELVIENANIDVLDSWRLVWDRERG